jgi:hypothetical protein
MTTAQIGVKSGNVIVPYVSTTKRTKELNISSGVTSNPAAATVEVSAIFYADSAGKWRMNFTGQVEYAAQANLSGDGTAYLTFATGSNFATTPSAQGVVMDALNDTLANQVVMCQSAASSNRLSFYGSSTTIRYLRFSGDVLLVGEPTTYTTAANMEGVIAADVYIPPASGATPGIVDGNAATWNGPKTFADAPIFNSGIYLDNVGGVQTLLNYFEFGTFNLNGDFASDVTVRYTRIDRIVIMTSEGVPGHSTPINTASTAASCVPAQLRPIGDPVTNVYLIGDGSVARMVQVSTAGVVTTNYYDVNPATGLFRLFSTGKSDTGTRFSITYELGAPA